MSAARADKSSSALAAIHASFDAMHQAMDSQALAFDVLAHELAKLRGPDQRMLRFLILEKMLGLQLLLNHTHSVVAALIAVAERAEVDTGPG